LILYPNNNKLTDSSCDQFEKELSRIANASGVEFRHLKAKFYKEMEPGSIDEVRQIAGMIDDFPKDHLFVIVVLPVKDTKRYNAVKTELDLYSKVSSQFVVLPNVLKCDASTLANIVAAINVKASYSVGKNAEVQLPFMQKPTTIIGIDVHHPPVGSNRPSEAAISASLDRTGTSYYNTFRTQKSRQESITEIVDMFREVVERAREKKLPPFEHFIILRDGVADTQFETICAAEIEALQKALSQNSYYGKVSPKITYIIAQKRNLCRLGAEIDNTIATPAAGTVVDSVITGVDQKDFYLIGHKAIQGSAKPVHFHVFLNEMKIPLANLQDLLFKLCHLHPGCTRSVSLPAPLYNAHKLAYRIGQVYRAAFENDEDNESHSQSSGGSSSSRKEVILPDFIKYTPFFL